MLTLLLADNHQMIRAGLSSTLERWGGFTVVAQVSVGCPVLVVGILGLSAACPECVSAAVVAVLLLLLLAAAVVVVVLVDTMS